LRRFITCQHAAFSLSTSDKFLLLKTLMNYCFTTIFLSVSTAYNLVLFIQKYFQIVLSLSLSLTFDFKPTALRLLKSAFRRCSISKGKAVSVTRYGHQSIDGKAEYKVSYYKIIFPADKKTSCNFLSKWSLKYTKNSGTFYC